MKWRARNCGMVRAGASAVAMARRTARRTRGAVSRRSAAQDSAEAGNFKGAGRGGDLIV